MDNLPEDKFLASDTAFMTSLFVGVADAFICVVYNVIFRINSPDFPASLINISYIIFGTLFIFTLIGLVDVVLLRYVPRGNLVHIALFILLTGVLSYRISFAHFPGTPLEDKLTSDLLRNFFLIYGVTAFAGIPLLHRNKWFLENIV